MQLRWGAGVGVRYIEDINAAQVGSWRAGSVYRGHQCSSGGELAWGVVYTTFKQPRCVGGELRRDGSWDEDAGWVHQ